MTLHHRIGYLLMSLWIVFVVSRPAAAQQNQYTITDLGKLGGRTSQAVGLSEDGYVAGWSETMQSNPNGSAIRKPFLWNRGIMTQLPSLAVGKGATSTAFAKPLITFFPTYYMAGDAETSTGATRAYLYKGGSITPVMTNLGTLANTTESHSRGVNSQGQVVGWAAAAQSPAMAFFYSGGAMKDISGGSLSAAYGINDAGQAVGYFYTGTSYHAFLYNRANNQRQDLGAAIGYSHSYALAINQSSQVVGYVSTMPFQTGNYRGFIYSNGMMRPIGTVNNVARAINNSGQVVGSFTAANGDRAYIHRNNQMTDLNTLVPATSGWVVRVALSINNAGQIVGYGTIGGEDHAFLMTPLPLTYNVVEIPLAPSTYVTDNSMRLNNRGQVVGESTQGHAAVWDRTSGVRELTGVTSHAYNINDFGGIVGESAGRAFYYSDGSMTDLGTLGGAGSVALGINNWSPPQIVGVAPAPVNSRAFITTPNSVSLTPLPLPPGSFTQSAATAINEFNQVVGEAQGMFANGPPFSMAFVWTANNGAIALPLGNFSSRAQAWDINNAGRAVGMMEISLGGMLYQHACIWKKDGSGQWRVTDLGLSRGTSKASAINNLGQIVGHSNIPANGITELHACLWHSGVMVDLNNKIPSNSGILLTTALDINDSGQIICFGKVLGQQQRRVYLLTR